MANRTLIFGGTFDPVHHGHLIVARRAAESLGLEQVVLMPTAANPLKPGPAAVAEHRLAMLRLAVADDPLFVVSDIEVHQTGPCYTIDTTEKMLQDNPSAELHWLVGADMLEDLPRWHRVDELLEIVTFHVACRPPATLEGIRHRIDALEGQLPASALDSLSRHAVATPLIDISSTQIRRRVAEAQSVRYLLPDSAAEYIRDKRLYEDS